MKPSTEHIYYTVVALYNKTDGTQTFYGYLATHPDDPELPFYVFDSTSAIRYPDEQSALAAIDTASNGTDRLSFCVQQCVQPRYIAYNYYTQATVAEADTMEELAIKLKSTRQLVSRYVHNNQQCVFKPRLLGGQTVIADSWTTDRFVPEMDIFDKRGIRKHAKIHAYKASTGEYIGCFTWEHIVNTIKCHPNGVRICLDSRPMYKYNLNLTSQHRGDFFMYPNQRLVHEAFDSVKRRRYLSTFHPEDKKWLGDNVPWEPNEHKPYHYMAIIGDPKEKLYIDYLETPEEFLLDNSESMV